MKCPFPIPMCLVAVGVVALGLLILGYGSKEKVKKVTADE